MISTTMHEVNVLILLCVAMFNGIDLDLKWIMEICKVIPKIPCWPGWWMIGMGQVWTELQPVNPGLNGQVLILRLIMTLLT